MGKIVGQYGSFEHPKHISKHIFELIVKLIITVLLSEIVLIWVYFTGWSSCGGPCMSKIEFPVSERGWVVRIAETGSKKSARSGK